MANEIQIRASLKYTPAAANQQGFDTGLLSKLLDITGVDVQAGTQVIGTTEEEITVASDLGTPGYMLIINVDPTNFVQLGPATTVYMVALKAGEFALFRLDAGASSLFAKADTANVTVQYWLLED